MDVIPKLQTRFAPTIDTVSRMRWKREGERGREKAKRSKFNNAHVFHLDAEHSGYLDTVNWTKEVANKEVRSGVKEKRRKKRGKKKKKKQKET